MINARYSKWFIFVACLWAGTPLTWAGTSELQIDDSTTSVPLGTAHLIVQPLVRAGNALHGDYRVEVTPLPFGGEHGQLTIELSAEQIHQLASGRTLEFQGEAVSTDGNHSVVAGTATAKSAAGGDNGDIKVRIESSKGKLVFKTRFHLK